MRNRLFVLSAIPLLAGMAGCAIGPDYVRPETAVPEQWLVDAKQAGEEKPAVLPDWRAFFPDARLQALIARALEHNRDLRIATARLAEARALYGISRAERLPEVEMLARREASRVPADISMSGHASNAQRYDVGVELLSYELDFWGRVRRLNEATLATYLASEEAQRAFRLSLIADVANAWFTQRELGERVRLARDIVANREAVRVIASQRRQVGLINSMDYLRAEAASEAARSELAGLEQSLVAAGNWLQLLTGRLPEAGDELPPGRPLAAQDLARIVPGLPSAVLLNRPDVLAAEQKLIAANAYIGAARAAFLPRVTLTGVVSTAGSDLSHLFDAGNGAWIFKPQLRLPLFDTGRASSNLDLAEARKHIAVAEYEKTIQQAFREVADLLSAREKLAEQLRAQESTRRIQRERLALMEARYQAQISHYLDVLDAQRELLQAEQAELLTRRQLLATVAQLYKALGGGAEPVVVAATAVE